MSDNPVEQEMRVTKRNGSFEDVSFDKILTRMKKLGAEREPLRINYTPLAMKVIDQLYPDIPTSVIDELTAEQCAALCTKHPDYGALASRIVVSNNHKNTLGSFCDVMKTLYDFRDIHGDHVPLIHHDTWAVVSNNRDVLDSMVDYQRDYLIDYFGFKTLERAYLMRVNKEIVERPQHMWLRVAVGIHGNDLDAVRETYDLMSQKYFTHATPTLFNAGTPRPQLSSCYLLAMEDDSIDGIYNTLKECAKISKWAGGIGLHIHNIRATGSHIRGTNGTSNGIVPMLQVFNHTARYVDQGGGKRNGSFAIYMEPWHADISDFLDLKKNHGDELMRARDLFYALWCPDLFMERVKDDGDWSLFCPDQCQGLSDCYGEEFNELYEKYEREGKALKTIKARKLWFKILDSQMETGTPYLLYKDAANSKSNQKNLGVIKSSNLCTEIIEYSSKDETAVCNLASIGLPMFVKEVPVPFVGDVKIYTKKDCKWCDLLKALLKRKNVEYVEVEVETDSFDEFKATHGVSTLPQLYDGDDIVGGFTAVLNLLRNQFDYEKLHDITKVVTSNLNKIIDVNFYPTDKTKRSNLLHRPIGIGVQGLADTFAMMDIPFHSDEAAEINKLIFETIYHAALERSNEISISRREGMRTAEKYQSYDMNIFANDSKVCREYRLINAQDEETIKQLLPIPPELASDRGELIGSYSTFKGSPASEGILQFDMWGVTPSDRYDWDTLRDSIKTYGLRNSLLLAPMPTASTSQILGNNECFEPFTSNIYTRRTIAGDYVIANRHMMSELVDLGLWSDEVKDNIIANKGSIQQIEGIPQFIKDKYKIVWEIPMRHMIDMAADRGAYICQSQSLNLWVEDPDYKVLTSMHFHSWKQGLKTGIYYLRRKPKHQPQQFTIDPEKYSEQQEEGPCEMCSA